MYDETLAFAILTRLNEEFPRLVQIRDLRAALPDFTNSSEQECLIAIHALIKLGRAQGRVLPSGMGEGPAAIANIEITEEGREFLAQGRQALEKDSGDLDDLLPIYAKGQFEKDVTELCAGATQSAPLGLLFIDLDHFKSVNDTFNHLVGNEVLIGVAKTLQRVCDRKGRSYRWGGEELAVLLPNFSQNEARALAERVREAISRTTFKNYPHWMTASIGVAGCPETSSALDLVKDADNAMLRAKEGGRDQICEAERASGGAGAPTTRLSVKEITRRVEAARLFPTIKNGVAANFLIQVETDAEDLITVKEVQLLSEQGISLSNPGRPSSEDLWRVQPRGALPLAWRADPDPAATLIRMNSDRGALFETEMKIVFSIEVLGKRKRFECKLFVRVDAFQTKIIQLAG